MEIVNNNGMFDILDGTNVVYTAQTIEEAQSYIEWVTRTDAGNLDCPDCPK
jgi:hypothetical protein